MLWHWCWKEVGMCGCLEGFLEEVCLIGRPWPWRAGLKGRSGKANGSGEGEGFP